MIQSISMGLCPLFSSRVTGNATGNGTENVRGRVGGWDLTEVSDPRDLSFGPPWSLHRSPHFFTRFPQDKPGLQPCENLQEALHVGVSDIFFSCSLFFFCLSLLSSLSVSVSVSVLPPFPLSVMLFSVTSHSLLKKAKERERREGGKGGNEEITLCQHDPTTAQRKSNGVPEKKGKGERGEKSQTDGNAVGNVLPLSLQHIK